MGDPPNNRPTPTASGTLARTPLLHLLLYALDRKLTGTIELYSRDERNAVVVFQGGEPRKVRTSEAVAYLGQVLVQLGHIPEDALGPSLAELAKRKSAGPALHGAVLLEQGLIDRSKLQAGLAAQIVQKLHFVASMPGETAYVYYDRTDALQGWGGDDGATVDPTPHLWSLLREHPPWDQVRATLARVAPSLLRLARGADVTRLRLSADETAAISVLGVRPLRVAELARAGGLDEETTQLLAHLLLVTKQVDVLNPAEIGPPSSGRLSSRPPPRPPAASQPPVPPQTSPVPAQNAAPPPAGLSPELAERKKEILERAATIDRADYFMMLDLARDATKDDVEGAFFALAKRWHPDRLPAELASVKDACSRVFARMSEARSTLADEEQRARYMRLLSDGSGTPETQDAVVKVIEASQNFQKAEVYFKRHDLAQAEAHCRLALEADGTQPDYVALLAWLLAQKPENASPAKTAESIKMLDAAVSMGARRCEKGHYWRGMLNKRIGRTDLAAKDFKRAMELNPRNIDAAREVRLHQMRSSGSAPAPERPSPDAPRPEDAAKNNSIFGRLFKKP
jgi:tetratricopeptide (TPR) repeat protein